MKPGHLLIARAGAAAAAAILLSGCGGNPDAAPSAVASAQPVNPPAQTSAAIPTLAPLAIGRFPATTDGRLARDACRQWAKLRVRYVSAVVNLSPYQLNQWFSGRDWARERSDWDRIGGDPLYNNLGSVFGTATLGDTASAANAALVDKGCEEGV